MMLFCRHSSDSIVVTVRGRLVVQNVRRPYADGIPFLHQLCKFNHHLRIGISGRYYRVKIVSRAAPEAAGAQSVDSYEIAVGGYPAASHRHIRSTVRIPGDDVRISFLHITEILRHIFPAVYAVLKTGFLRPVKTVNETVVGPLCVVILGHQINVAVVLAQIPVLGRHACPRCGSIGLQHFLGKLQESAVLGIRPCIQPVGSGSNQVNGTIHTGQGTVVVGKLVRPSDIIDFQLRVYLLRQDRVQLLQHGVNGSRLIAGGRVARGHIGDHHML